MSTWYKQGTWGELQPEAAEGVRKVERLYDKNQCSLFITALRDGTHMPGSYHPSGRAFDFRKHEKITKVMIQEALGKGFDVVEHSTHFHVEWDPK